MKIGRATGGVSAVGKPGTANQFQRRELVAVPVLRRTLPWAPPAGPNRRMRTLCAGILLAASAAILPAARNLEIYAIDVEGGQATLIVSPSGESMLVDTGWGGHNKRDAERIPAAAKMAGVKKIDYLVITHYHADHVGGIAQLAEKMPIHNFVDHGANVEDSKQGQVLYNEYVAFRAKGNHIEVKPVEIAYGAF